MILLIYDNCKLPNNHYFPSPDYIKNMQFTYSVMIASIVTLSMPVSNMNIAT